MSRITAKADYVGPFFATDIDKTIEQNIQTLLHAFAKAGEEEVVRKLLVGQTERDELNIEGIDATRVYQRVEGRVRNLQGAPWHRFVTVSPSAAGLTARQAIGLYASASRIEGRTRIFKSTATALRRSVREMKAIDMARGLA